MVHRGSGERGEVRRGMTRFARCAAGRNVGGGHSRGLHAVVTASAATRDSSVFEYRAPPTDRRMARVALEIRLDVCRPLALRLHVVVAGRAAPQRFGMIEIDCWVPCYGCVAAIAPVRGEYVSRVFRRCADRRADTVAGAAVARSPLEHRIGMTRLAGQVTVLPQELETRREVIERIPGLGGKCRRERHQCEYQRCGDEPA